MKLSFLGAARQVTGSMFLLELEDNYKILIDCGSDFSRSKDEHLFPFRPSDLNLVLLTHAHLDHSGNIPHLIMEGYRGQILCTPATHSLTQIILNDSASLFSRSIKRKLSREKSKHRKDLSGISHMYLEKQVNEAIDRFLTIGFHKRFEVRQGLHITFIPTGHLLGASNILIEAEDRGKTKKILFSGDIGRKNYPLLPDPVPVPQVDYLICESTYGMRKHYEKGNPEEILQNIIQKACVDLPGRLIIPSFSVGRTQSLLFSMHKLAVQKKLPSLKIFADSPMAEESTKVYEEYIPLLNEEAREFYKTHKSLFDFQNLVHVTSFKESKAVSNYTEPCVIISSSGMITGGRVEDHLKKNLSNPYCTILMIGYCAEGTPGYQLIHQKTLTIKGRNVPVTATIISTDIFSGHGDQDDLIRFVKSQSRETLQKLFLVHGDYDSMIGFKKLVEAEGYKNVEMPKKGEVFEL